MSRYARQISVNGVGEAGQAKLRAGHVRIHGRGLATEICGLYLAGAGVGSLEVDQTLVSTLSAINKEVQIVATSVESRFGVAVGPEQYDTLEGTALAQGAEAARWAMALLLNGRSE